MIDVHDLSPEEKRQILYNHVKLGKQSRSFEPRSTLTSRLTIISASFRKRPTDCYPLFTRDLFIDEYYMAGSSKGGSSFSKSPPRHRP